MALRFEFGLKQKAIITTLVVLSFLYTQSVNAEVPYLTFTGNTSQTLNAGQVSNPITVQRMNMEQPVTSGTTVVTVSTDSSTGQFSTSVDGPWSSTLSLNISDGSSSATFYFQDSTVGNPTITAYASGFVDAVIHSLRCRQVPQDNSQTVTVSTTNGDVQIYPTVSAGLISNFTAVPLSSLSPELQAAEPLGGTFSYGLFSFDVTRLVPGTTFQAILHFSQPIPSGMQYWKVNNGNWTDVSNLATIGSDTITLSLTDGGPEDPDNAANGQISDPGGPFVLPALPHAGETRIMPPSLLGSDISNFRINDGFTLAGDSYTVSNYAIDVPTHRLVLNAPYNITLKAYDTPRGGGIANIGLYFGQHPMLNLLDTKLSIDWDKDSGIRIQDPSGYIKKATVTRTIDQNENIFTITFTPIKPMATSDVYVRMWNAKDVVYDRVMLNAVKFSGEFLSPSQVETPSTTKIYDNAIDLGKQLDVDGYNHPKILSKITRVGSVFPSTPGQVLFFYDTYNKVVSRVITDGNGNVVDVKLESLIPIPPPSTTAYTNLHLNRNNPAELEAAQAAEAIKSMMMLIQLYGMDFVVQYHMLGNVG